MKITCPHCKRRAELPTGAVNRAAKDGHAIYCSRKCSGLARLKHKPKTQKVEEKRLYDIQYRRRNRAMLKAKKRAYFERTYDRVKAAEVRRRRMPYHVAYCRQPAYRRWKRRYDQNFRAQKMFGPYADSFLLLMKLEKEVASRMTKYEIMLANNTLNKALHRRRQYARLIRG